INDLGLLAPADIQRTPCPPDDADDDQPKPDRLDAFMEGMIAKRGCHKGHGDNAHKPQQQHAFTDFLDLLQVQFLSSRHSCFPVWKSAKWQPEYWRFQDRI